MRKILVTTAILAVLIGITAVFFGKSTYHRLNEQRHIRIAQKAFKNKEYTAAWLRVRKALSINSNSVDGCRLMVELSDLQRSPASLHWHQKLAEVAPTPENRLSLASYALTVEPEPFALASRTLASFRSHAEQTAEFHVVSAVRAARLKDVAAAERHLKEAIGLEPGNRVHLLNLAVLQLESADSNMASHARATLSTLSQDPQCGTAAVRSLVADSARRKDWARALDSSSRLLSGTNANFTDRICHLSILTEYAPLEADAYLVELQSLAATHSADIAELGTWLNQRKMAEVTIEWLTGLPVHLRNEPALRRLIVEAHTIREDWTSLQKWLTHEKWGDDDFLRFAILACSVRALGQEDSAKINWNQALTAAARFSHIVALGELAQSRQWTDAVEQVLWQLARRFPGQSSALDVLEQQYYQQGDTRGLLNVQTAKLKINPKDIRAKSALALLSMLLSQNTAKAHAIAHEMYHQNPTNAAAVCGYAYSLYIKGRADEGLSVLRSLSENELRRPQVAIYYALLLAAAGYPEEGCDYRGRAESGLLLPEERALLAGL